MLIFLILFSIFFCKKYPVSNSSSHNFSKNKFQHFSIFGKKMKSVDNLESSIYNSLCGILDVHVVRRLGEIKCFDKFKKII